MFLTTFQLKKHFSQSLLHFSQYQCTLANANTSHFHMDSHIYNYCSHSTENGQALILTI